MARTKGSMDVSEDKKARILAKKNLQVSTQKNIAEEGVCRETVVKITKDSVDYNTLIQSQKYETRYVEDLKRTNYKLLKYLEDSVDAGTLPPNVVSTAFGTTFDKIQIKRNQPMQITSQPTDEEMARIFFEQLVTVAKWERAKAAAMVKLKYPGNRCNETVGERNRRRLIKRSNQRFILRLVMVEMDRPAPIRNKLLQ